MTRSLKRHRWFRLQYSAHGLWFRRLRINSKHIRCRLHEDINRLRTLSRGRNNIIIICSGRYVHSRENRGGCLFLSRFQRIYTERFANEHKQFQSQTLYISRGVNRIVRYTSRDESATMKETIVVVTRIIQLVNFPAVSTKRLNYNMSRIWNGSASSRLSRIWREHTLLKYLLYDPQLIRLTSHPISAGRGDRWIVPLYVRKLRYGWCENGIMSIFLSAESILCSKFGY